MRFRYGSLQAPIHYEYVRLPDLLLELEMARNDGTYKKVQSKYANPVLLIIDDGYC